MIYAYSTKTHKIITIKSLNYFKSSNKGYNLILDTNNNIKVWDKNYCNP